MFCRRQTARPPVRLGCAVSRNDFLDSLRVLGARMSVPHPYDAGSVRGELQAVSLSCSRDVWQRVIGLPTNIVCHYSPSRGIFFHSWEHHWIGGSVKCFGYLFERGPNSQWVFLNRALFLDHPYTTHLKRKDDASCLCNSFSGPERTPVAH